MRNAVFLWASSTAPPRTAPTATGAWPAHATGGQAAPRASIRGIDPPAHSEYGDPHGAPVVWCHGGLSSRIDASFAAAGLDGIRLISADRPGIGQTPRAPARRVVDWAADVERLADSLGIERFVVAGWSAGGPFALACAARLTGRVTAAATLGGIAPPAAEVETLGLRTDRLLERLARTAPALGRAVLQIGARIGDERAARETLRALPEADRRVLADLPAAQIVHPFRAALAPGAAGTMDDYRAFGSEWGFELSEVRVPVTCWHGELDTLVPRSHAEYLVGHLPNARLEQVAGAGHFLMVEHAPAVFGALRVESP